MKISVQELWRNVVAAAVRFPFVAADSVVVTALALSAYSLTSKNMVVQHLFLTAILGFPLLLSFTLFAERSAWPGRFRMLFPLPALIFHAIYYFTSLSEQGDAGGIRFAALLAGFLFLLSFAPYVNTGSMNGFWRYNKSLVIGFALAGSASIALMAGIGLAFAGMDYLLGIDFPNRLYARSWIITSCLLWPFIFLATIPRNFEQLESGEMYSKAMEVFNRFIVIPLVLVYMLILYLYTGRMIIEASWPKGGVAGYIIGFSVLGLLSVVLMHPLKDREGNRWIGAYLKWLCVFILPQTVVLFLSVWRRVSEYGFTESRYFGVLAAFLLAGICIYLLASRAKNIKVIPIILCIAALLSAAGPWGAPNISERSQFRRLEQLLEKHGILAEGKVVKARQPVPDEDQGAISAIVGYLHKRHGPKSLQPLFKQDLAAGKSFGHPGKMLRLMGLSYIPYYSKEKRTGNQMYFAFYVKKTDIHRISGYTYYLRIGSYGNEEYTVDVNGKKYKISLRPKTGEFVIARDKKILGTLDVMPLVLKLKNRNGSPASHLNIPQEDMTLEGRAGNVAIKALFSEMHMVERHATLELTRANADVLLKIKD